MDVLRSPVTTSLTLWFTHCGAVPLPFSFRERLAGKGLSDEQGKNKTVRSIPAPRCTATQTQAHYWPSGAALCPYGDHGDSHGLRLDDLAQVRSASRQTGRANPLQRCHPHARRCLWHHG